MAIADTTLPAGTIIKTHGCGPYHLAVPTPPQTDEQRNRRVEVFFFEGRIDPPPLARCPSGGCSQYQQWVKRSVHCFDLEHPFGELEVSVIDPASQPVAAAEVHIAGPSVEDLTCDANGAGRADDLIPGAYTILGHAKGFRDGTAQVSVNPAGPGVPAAKAVVQLRDATGDLGVSVTGQGGKAVDGAAIEVKDAGGASVAKATADAGGRATIPKLPEGSYKVTASAKGFIDGGADATVVGGQSNQVAVLLSRANLVIRLPYTVADSSKLPHSFSLSSEDGSVSQSRKLAADCWAGENDQAFFDFGILPEDKTYSLQCNDGAQSYALFEKIPFAKLQEKLGAQAPATKERPRDGDDPPVSSSGGGARVAEVEGGP